MKLLCKREGTLAQHRPVSAKQLELEAAKEVLSEIFCIRPGGGRGYYPAETGQEKLP
jgi:hypothetical protein